MADNTEDFGTNGEKRDDSFDEMLDRAEADLDAAEAEEAAGYEDDGNEDDEEGAARSVGHVVSDEMRAAALIDPDMPNPHGAIVEGANGGNGTIVRTAYLGKEMQTSFLEYSMSVIVARALPDVRDGLKPVHRRILYAMNESGYTPNRPHMKSARTVGDVIGKYHPHGDLAVYDTMVRLAQPFSMRVPLVDGHGNFGSIDGDSAAAMRYTEARLDKAAMELLRDLDKETVDFQPNYDESLEEPSVLPARFPNLLVNGSSGIAVGMATNIPPHNLGETIDATCMMLDNPDVTTEELMTALPGPDFPTGGIIMGKKGILDAYETGRGSLTVRAKCEVQEKKNGKSCIVVSEIPYQVNRQRLLEKLGELVRDKKLPEISNIHDGADRHGIDIIIDLKSNAMPQVVLNKLFKHTQLQVGFGVIMLALVDGVPRVLSLKEMLHYYIAHQEEVIVRRTRYELAKAEERAHILEGYIIALDNIDEVIHIIRSSETDAEAAKRLTERFGLSKRQTDAILEMKLRRLTGLERTKIEEELDALREKIAYYKRVLSDDALVREIIKEELQEIKKKYGTSRKTRLSGDAKDIDVEDLIADENMVVTVTKAGYVKRLPVATYRQQKRGGKGMQGVNLKDNDYVVFKKTVVPAVTAATALSGGTDGTYSGGQISGAFTAFESCTFNTLVVEGTSTDDEAAANYAERQREKYGKKFQAVISDIGKASAVDHEGVVKVPNKALNVSDLTGQLKFWTAGALAGCPINRSLTNTVYDGEYEVDVNYSQAELESLIENGFFAFHRVGDDVRVLLDRNSLVTYTEDKGELFNDNQVIRVADQIANDIAVIFNTKYIGAVQNNATGRALFKADIIQHHNRLQDMNAIEGFTADSVTIEAGTEKGAVVVTDAVTVVGTMTKLYMTVYVS